MISDTYHQDSLKKCHYSKEARMDDYDFDDIFLADEPDIPDDEHIDQMEELDDNPSILED